MSSDLIKLESIFPAVRWRSPLLVKCFGGRRIFACRVCVALDGLKADSPYQWKTEAEVQEHIRRDHLNDG